jgi:hypothetical protein
VVDDVEDRDAVRPHVQLARATRATYRAHQDEPRDDGAVDVDEPTVVLSLWQYLGSGYLNPGDMLLAAGVEASLRTAREALTDLRRGPP